jgi:hypothetical protein
VHPAVEDIQVRGKEHHNILVGNKDLEGANNLSQRNTLVCLPVVQSLSILNKDNEILIRALVVALDLWCFSASHDCCLSWESLFRFGVACVEIVLKVGDLELGLIWFGTKD